MKKSILVIACIVIVVFAIAVVLKFELLPIHFGSGTGDGSGITTGSSVNTSTPPETNSSEENKISEIRIDGNDIYFDNELCADEDELKQKITNIGTEHKYIFVYDNAIKGTYDKVNKVLSDLKNALGITITET